MSCFEPNVENFKRFTQPNDNGQRISCRIGDDWYHINGVEANGNKISVDFKQIDGDYTLKFFLAVGPNRHKRQGKDVLELTSVRTFHKKTLQLEQFFERSTASIQ